MYAILCNATGHVYIGGTADMPQRFKWHFDRLRIGKHTNRRLQSLYDEHGELSLSWVILETMRLRRHKRQRERISLHRLGIAEKKWIRDMRREVGELVLNQHDHGINGRLSPKLSYSRQLNQISWPPPEFGGPSRLPRLKEKK